MKKGIVLGLFLLVVVGGVFLFHGKKEEPKKVEKEEPVPIDYVEELSTSYPEFEKEFLLWIKNSYGEEVLKQLKEACEEGTYEKSIWHTLTGNSYLVLQDLYHGGYENQDHVTVKEGKKDYITISFSGDISLADNWKVMPKYLERKKGIYGILSEEVVQYMNQVDLMVVNNEFCFSTRGTPLPKKTYTFRANPKHVSVYQEMGVDLVTLANNHVYDYGKDAFLDTLKTLEDASLPYIGAGRNITDAKEPYYFIINGYKIAFVNATRAEKFILTPEATKTTPGVFRAYDPKPFAQLIQETKEKSDYVIALIHWGKEDSHALEEVQKETGKLYIDSGADLVVGTHAHELQGVEFYKGKLIAYNLGDFIFNSQTKNTGLLTWTLTNQGESTFSFQPALQTGEKTSFVSGKDASKVYQNMTKWSVNGMFEDDGNIVEAA